VTGPRPTAEAVRRIADGRVVGVWAIAIIALHIADDSFLHPEPGTAAGDHLASGLVPLAALLAAGLAVRRSRPGVRAVVALIAGVLGIVIGAASGGYESFTVGPAGDDFTGLIAVPAGIVLVGIGIRTLWTSRRRDERLTRRYARRTLIALVVAVTAQGIVYPIGFGFVVTHVMRKTVPSPRLGAAHEDVSFTTHDGLRLRGWYVPSRNGAAVIAFPGRTSTQAHARMLVRRGYGVLVFDRRGEGASDGASNLLGWGGDEDILAAVRFLQQRPDVRRGKIGGLGLSVGGELMLQAAAEGPGLEAVVSEGAGTRAFEEDMQDAHGLNRVLLAPLSLLQTAAISVFANEAPPPKLTDLAPRITQPLFLIWAPHGGNQETMNPVYYRLARGPKEIWAMPSASHMAGISDRPAEYERRVVGFFDRYLLGSEPVT
jgi:uncharacterized protein